MTYKDAGVDIEKAEGALDSLKDKIRSTYTKGVLDSHGSFCGFFSLEGMGVGKGLLVSSTDGVGTKCQVASMVGIFNTIGKDIVNHCVNDILSHGGEPLFFLDYYGSGRLDPSVMEQVVSGVVEACRENGVALIGGETAEMPGTYKDEEFDLVGTIVGIVRTGKPITGEGIRPGDRLVALGSSGLHTNGYSLARKVLFGSFDPNDRFEGSEETIAEALLKVHRSYKRVVLPLLEGFDVRGIAHITGGGLVGNVPRILPEGLKAVVDTSAVPRPPIFDFIVGQGGIEREEAYRVFNMGFGMVLVLPEDQVREASAFVLSKGERMYECGEIREGVKRVELLF